MALPILTCATAWDVQKSVSLVSKTTALGDGYQQFTLLSPTPERVEWAVKSPALTKAVADSILSQLATFQGITAFLWSPDNELNIPREAFFCDKWTLTPLGINAYEIAATFTRDINSQCLAFAGNINETVIPAMLEGAINWLSTYTRDTQPLVANAQGVSVNAFHTVVGRGGYFPPSSGTSEGQVILIKALMMARKTVISAGVKTTALNLATLYSTALISYFYGEAIPTVATTQLWFPHWLVNSKEPFVSKGKLATKSINNGFFNVQVSFTNGVGTISSGTPNFGETLSDVYRVYSTDGKLLWQNVYAPVAQGTEYSVNYWVSNTQLLGTNYQVFPTSSGSSGQSPVVTAETTGKIVLNNTTFTGNAIVVYAAYIGVTIAKNTGFEAYPFWRQLLTSPQEKSHALDVSAWASEAFELMRDATGDSKWQQAYDANKYSTVIAALVANNSFLYKIDTTVTDAFSYPGTQLVISNNSSGGTATRLGDGWVQATINDGTELYPVAELQNFNASLQIDSGLTLDIDLGCSQNSIMEVFISISKDAFNFALQYTFYQPVTANVSVTKSIKPDELIQWTATSQWHPTIADSPIYTYSGGGGSTNVIRELKNIATFDRLVSTATVSQPDGGYAGIGFVMFNITNKVPPINYALSGGTAQIKVVDSASQTYLWDLPNTIGAFQTFFPTFANATTGSSQLPGDGTIQSFEIIPKGTSNFTVNVRYLGDPPNILPYPCISYKSSLVSRVNTAHTFKVGNFQGKNSLLSVLTGNPGVVPFTTNLLADANGKFQIDAWRGKPFVAYQSESMWFKWGYLDRVNQVLDFKLKSQDAYAKQNVNNTTGFFVQAYNWATFGVGAESNSINQYTYIAADPSTDWGGYAVRSVEATAKYWMQNPKDVKASTIVMRFLSAIDNFYRKNGNNIPPSNYPSVNDPYYNYINIHDSFLLCRAALYANIAGGNASVTFRVLKKSLDMMTSEYTPSGNMAGTFSNSQPSFTLSSQNYKEMYGFWVGESIITMSELLLNKNLITYPSCSTSLI